MEFQRKVVVAGVKLKILKANHNQSGHRRKCAEVVVAGVKLKILKANHNSSKNLRPMREVVVAGVKLKILKANHNEYSLTLNVVMLLLLV